MSPIFAAIAQPLNTTASLPLLHNFNPLIRSREFFFQKTMYQSHDFEVHRQPRLQDPPLKQYNTMGAVTRAQQAGRAAACDGSMVRSAVRSLPDDVPPDANVCGASRSACAPGAPPAAPRPGLGCVAALRMGAAAAGDSGGGGGGGELSVTVGMQGR